MAKFGLSPTPAEAVLPDKARFPAIVALVETVLISRK
jgi:hypothetical protein